MALPLYDRSGSSQFRPPIGEQINIEHMPLPSRVLSAGNLTAVIWGSLAPEPEDLVREMDGAGIETVADSLLAKGSGVYCVVLGDQESRRCCLFVDPFSCKKVFYCAQDDTIYLATTVSRLVGAGLAEPLVDAATAASLLMYDYVPTNHTLVRAIRSLKPSTIYSYHNGVLTESAKRPFEVETQGISYEAAVRGTFKRLEHAYATEAEPFDSLIVPLSGGRDSRALLGLALKDGGRRIHTFTAGQPGTLDYEIGGALARRLGLECSIYDVGRGFYADHVIPSTPYANGLINHFLAPCNLLSERLQSTPGQAILSGFIGDLVLGAKEGSIPLVHSGGVSFPAPKQLPFEIACQLIPGVRSQLLDRLSELQSCFEPSPREGSISLEDWYYRIRVTSFTASALFGEKDQGFAFLAPFIQTDFLRWMLSLPKEYRSRPSFYRDVIAVDEDLRDLFRFPLKNLNGAGYFVGKWNSARSVATYGSKALVRGARPKENYANFRRIYPGRFVLREIEKSDSLERLLGIELDPSCWARLTYAQKTLLLSLKLHLDDLFGANA